jgi:hypothetical protein
MFVAVAGISLVVRVFAGSDFTLIPWPIALIVIPIGVFLIRTGGPAVGRTESPHFSLGRREDA